MKQIIAMTILVSLPMLNCVGQITYESTYTTAEGENFFDIINLGNDEYKYLTIDYTNNLFSLYNLDLSLYQTVNIPISLEEGSYTPAYITLSLFDCEPSNIEYAIFRPVGYGNFYVFRDDGTLIFEEDSVRGIYSYGQLNGTQMRQPIYNTPVGAKLILLDMTNLTDHHIFSLCGELPVQISEIVQSPGFVQLYPNPSDGMVTIDINAPNNVDDFELLIFNSSMQVLKQIPVFGYNSVKIDNSELSSGVYFYSLKTQSKVLDSGKFVIAK